MNNDHLSDIYDILAQNNNMVTKEGRDKITALIDHIDYDKQCIYFIDDRGVHYRLQLTADYSPASM